MDQKEDTSVYLLLHQIIHLSKYHAMKEMDAFGLKPNQAGILFILNCKRHLSQRELAEKMGITPPSMTVALRKLEDQGYVMKESDPNDQRIVRIQISEKGKEYLRDMKEIMSGMENVLYQGMSPEERMLLKRLLHKMRNNLLNSKDSKGMAMMSVMKKTKPTKKHDYFL